MRSNTSAARAVLDRHVLAVHRLREHRPDLIGKLLRCFAVSLITTAVAVATLTVLISREHVAAAAANVIATVTSTLLSYALNRRWVWAQRGRSDFRRHVLPFWLLSGAGLVLSTVAVGVASTWAERVGLAPAGKTTVAVLANVAAFGALWGVQFMLLDRWFAGGGFSGETSRVGASSEFERAT